MKILENNKSLIIIVIVAVILFAFVGLIIFKDTKMTEEKDFIHQMPSNQYNKDYKENEIIPILVTDEQIAKIYFSKFVTDAFNNPQKIYDQLDQSYKKKYFESYEDFEYYLEGKTISFLREAIVKKYAVKSSSEGKDIYVEDKSGLKIIFTEHSINNYTITMD